MGTKNFLLLSLEDDKTKKVANVVSNDSCRKILDYLSEREATVTELSKKLGIPLSTVHYNLDQLMKAGLVVTEEFHYSEKGKEINHYKLANKYIIISPKKVFGIKQKLRSILPVGLLAIGAAGVLQLVSRYLPQTAETVAFSQPIAALQKDAITEAPAAAEAVEEGAAGSIQSLRTVAADTADNIVHNITQPEVQVTVVNTVTDHSLQFAGLIFLAGALFALAAYLIIRRKEV